MNRLRQTQKGPAKSPVLVADNSGQLLALQVQHINADRRLHSILEKAMLAGGPTLAKSLGVQVASLSKLAQDTKARAFSPKNQSRP
jgi:hypothetical protein